MVKRIDFYCKSYVLVKIRGNSLLKSGTGMGVIGRETAIRTRSTGSRMSGSGWDGNPFFLSGTPVGRRRPQPRRSQPDSGTLRGVASPINATDGWVPVIRSSMGGGRTVAGGFVHGVAGRDCQSRHRPRFGKSGELAGGLHRQTARRGTAAATKRPTGATGRAPGRRSFGTRRFAVASVALALGDAPSRGPNEY
jgi:hypothetical protein